VDTPDFVPGFKRPSPEEIVEREGAWPGFVSASVPTIGGTLVGGFWLDSGIIRRPDLGDVSLSIVADGKVFASTLPLKSRKTVGVTFSETFKADLDKEVTARARELSNGVSVLASIPADRGNAASNSLLISILVLLILALIGTAALAMLLARLIIKPLDEVSLAAQAVSEGRFDQRIPVRSRDEVGRLAVAFNQMTDRLAATIGELSSSRDMLRRAVRRVGETLRSTHDMQQLFESILNTTADAAGADAAVVWVFTPTREELYPALARGITRSSLGRVKVGEGVVGFAAERAMNVVLPARDGGPRPASNEPLAPVSIAMPLYSDERIVAVLVAYRDEAIRRFTTEDTETLTFLAEQAGVAIENALLHEEAQRLSLTDGLTGIYNRRYFQMNFRGVLATSVRFDRKFSVLMVDLDHFKQINDTYGHNRGDAILIEFSKRVSAALREVDTFARYGGEEFVCLLSETDMQGAVTAAEKILDAIRSEPFGGRGETPVRLTVSIGIASFPGHGETFTTLIDAADRGLYRAKAEGRDRARIPGDPPPGLRIAK
ncbi:MAG: diguanylate cyclase, partial [Actinobacteria bacterium]|nr:diguanylate cyclase [Actinomycetota bacterium]